MEQRNGRIDRKLQPNAEVFCHYFVYKQRPEDRILAALVRKTETISEELGSLAQVIDDRLDAVMKRGIRRGRDRRDEQDIETADLEADTREPSKRNWKPPASANDLRTQIDRLRTIWPTRRRASAWTRTTSARQSPAPWN